jgi:hypothetical protein
MMESGRDGGQAQGPGFLPPRLIPGVHEVTSEELAAASAGAASTGATVLSLSSEGASTRADFFDAVRESLPLNPPLMSSRSWDALSDSLWEGIYRLDAPVVAILWTGASDLRRNAPDDFAIAIAVLRDMASSLGNENDTNGEPRQVCIYVS